MTTTDTSPLVQITVPRPAPITDGTAMVNRVRDLVVNDPTSYEMVAQVRATARTRWKEIDKQRSDLKAPSLEAGRRIDEFFKPVLAAFQEAGELSTAKLNAYDEEQRKIAAEKQRKADEEARVAREKAEAAARAERERLAEQERQRQIAEAQQRAEQERAAREAAEAKERSERAAREAAEAAAAGDRAKAEQAKKEAAAARQQALDAEIARRRAEADAEKARAEAEAAKAQAEEKIDQLETVALTTVAERVEADTVQVAGLSRAKVYKWRLVDKSKVKSDYLVLDEKTISRVVTSAKERAAEIIGGIEVYVEQSLRQGK